MRIRARNMRYCLSPAPAFLPGESCRASETDIHEEEGPRRRGRVSGSGGREPGTGWRIRRTNTNIMHHYRRLVEDDPLNQLTNWW